MALKSIFRITISFYVAFLAASAPGIATTDVDENMATEPLPSPPDTTGPPKKIIFNDSMDIDMDLQFNTTDGGANILPGSQDDEDLSQWLVVTSSGYEFQGSVEVLHSLFEDANSTSAGSLDDLYAKYGEPKNDRKAAMISTHSKRAIFGIDMRVRVSQPSHTFPFSAVGKFDIGCTGVFIGPRHILTAAHCVYNLKTRQWRTNLNFRRAKDCDPDGGEYYQWTTVLTTRGYTVFGFQSYDYALVVVNRTSPHYMVYGWNNQIFNDSISIPGYPGDSRRNCMYTTSCKTIYHATEQLGYQCDTYPGNSGSPVYIYFESSNLRIVYCVHAYGGTVQNTCTRITKTRHEILQRWIRDY